MLGYEPLELTAIAGAMFIAGFVKGATGMGFATTCLALMALALGLKESLPLVIAPSLVSNVVVMVGAGHFRESVNRFWPMLALAPVGVVIGLFALAHTDGAEAGAALGAVLLLYCAFAFAQPHWRLPEHLERPGGPLVGLTTGMVNGLTGSQVMPILPYLMSLGLKREVFVQAINLSFTLSSLVMVVGLARLGLMSTNAALISVAGVAISIAGVRGGEAMRRRLSDAAFRVAVLVVLSGAGLGLLTKGWS